MGSSSSGRPRSRSPMCSTVLRALSPCPVGGHPTGVSRLGIVSAYRIDRRERHRARRSRGLGRFRGLPRRAGGEEDRGRLDHHARCRRIRSVAYPRYDTCRCGRVAARGAASSVCGCGHHARYGRGGTDVGRRYGAVAFCARPTAFVGLGYRSEIGARSARTCRIGTRDRGYLLSPVPAAVGFAPLPGAVAPGGARPTLCFRASCTRASSGAFVLRAAGARPALSPAPGLPRR